MWNGKWVNIIITQTAVLYTCQNIIQMCVCVCVWCTVQLNQFAAGRSVITLKFSTILGQLSHRLAKQIAAFSSERDQDCCMVFIKYYKQ